MRRSVAAGIGGGLLLVLLAVIVRTCSLPVTPGPGPLVRSLPALATPQSEALVFHKGFGAWLYSTPQAVPTTHPDYQAGAYFPLGLECKQPLDSVWATGPTGCSGDTCATSNIDWSDYDDCLALAASQTIMIEPGVVISRPVALMLPPPWGQGPVGGSGTLADPYNDIYVPAWLAGDMAFKFPYSDGTTYYNGIRFDSDTVQDRLVQMIAEAGTRYSGNDQIVLVRLNPGESEEWFQIKCNKSHSGCNNATILQEHEKTVTCTEYRTWLTRLTDAALAAFPNKPIAIGAATNNCYDSAYNKGYEARYKFFADNDAPAPGYWMSTPTPMGISLHHLQPDSLDADEYGAGVPAGWGQLVVAEKAATAVAPLALEYRVEPESAAGDKWEWNYWALLYAAALDADFVARTTDWYLYDSWEYWNVAWDRLGLPEDFAWVTFRDAEWQGMTWASGTYGTTGQRGDFASHLAVMTPTRYPQYCDSDTINAAATSIANPVYATNAFTYLPCGLPRTPGPTPYKLPTPKATLQATPLPDATSQFNMLQRLRDRQARRIGAGETMVIAADTAWTHYGSTMDLTLTLDYLDIGTAPISVSVVQGAGYDTKSISRANTGLWQRAAWTVASATITNTSANGFVVIYPPTTELYVGDLTIAVDTALTPTPTRTNTPTPTPTDTPGTPTPSVTPSVTPTPTGTAGPSPTPGTAGLLLSEICLGPSSDLNLDGAVDFGDRAIEMLNWSAAAIDLSGYMLTWSDSCAVVGASQTFRIPAYSLINADKTKVVYGRDMRDLTGAALTIPAYGTFRLCSAAGTQLDSVTMPEPVPACYRRSGDSWEAATDPDLGR